MRFIITWALWVPRQIVRRRAAIGVGIALLLAVAWVDSYFTRTEMNTVRPKQWYIYGVDHGRFFLTRFGSDLGQSQPRSFQLKRFDVGVPSKWRLWSAYQSFASPHYEILGFSWGIRRPGVAGSPTTGFVATVPIWSLIALALIPAMNDARRAICRRRQPLAHCAGCGYDLRATPERCPECGRVPEGHLVLSREGA